MGLSGFAMDQSSKGFLAGATGALTANIYWGLFAVFDARGIAAIAVERLKAKGKPITIQNVQKAIKHEVHIKANYAKLAAGAVAALTGQNASAAIAAATNVVDNDIAVRGSLYALEEFQAMVAAATQAFAQLENRERIVLSGLELEFALEQERASSSSAHDEQASSHDQTDRRPFVEDPK